MVDLVCRRRVATVAGNCQLRSGQARGDRLKGDFSNCLEVSVTFDERGYIEQRTGTAAGCGVALSLGGLRRRIEIAMLPDDVRVVLQLDGLVERECHRRQAQASLSRIAQLDQRTALPDQCLHSAEADVRPPRRKSGFDPKRS